MSVITDCNRENICRVSTAGSVETASDALLVSFNLRNGVGGGSMASRGFRAVIARTYRNIFDVYQDDVPGTRTIDGCSLVVERRSKLDMLYRLVARGRLGRLRFRFAPSGCKPGSACDAIIDGIGFADVLSLVRHRFERTVVLHHNFEPDYYADAVSGWRRRLLVRAAYRSMRQAFREATFNLFLTRSDLEKTVAAIGRPRGHAAVLGAYESTVPLRRQSSVRKGPIRVLVTGNLSARKGHLGLLQFLRHAGASGGELKSRLSFVIAGRNPPGELQALADGGLVKLTGDSPSIEEVAAECDVYLNPNYTGSGIKIRNFDGLRHGLPVLCRVENAAGFEDLTPPIFRTFCSNEDGLRLLESLDVSEIRCEEFRRRVWQDYADHFGVERGVARWREILEGTYDAL